LKYQIVDPSVNRAKVEWLADDNKGAQYRMAPPDQNTLVFGSGGRRQELENENPINFTVTLQNSSPTATSENLLLASWTGDPYGFFSVTLRNVPVAATTPQEEAPAAARAAWAHRRTPRPRTNA
jgi:hypothetical protein